MDQDSSVFDLLRRVPAPPGRLPGVAGKSSGCDEGGILRCRKFTRLPSHSQTGGRAGAAVAPDWRPPDREGGLTDEGLPPRLSMSRPPSTSCVQAAVRTQRLKDRKQER